MSQVCSRCGYAWCQKIIIHRQAKITLHVSGKRWALLSGRYDRPENLATLLTSRDNDPRPNVAALKAIRGALAACVAASAWDKARELIAQHATPQKGADADLSEVRA
jgi:hypothetical protein